ncbi:MAG: hypothetical protein ACRD01_14865 [Terriglobales bacterium]
MDIYFRQQIDNSRLVRVANPAARRERRLLVGAVALLLALGWGYCWQRYAVVQVGYQLAGARRQAAQLEQWNRGLELQQAALTNPGRIYALATARLGMRSAAPGQVLALDEAPAGTGATRTQAAMLTSKVSPASFSRP